MVVVRAVLVPQSFWSRSREVLLATSHSSSKSGTTTCKLSKFESKHAKKTPNGNVGCRRRRQVWLSGAQTARIPRNSRAGKQRGRLPVLLGENRRELGEIEAFWNERSRFPERARCPRPLPSSRGAYNAAAVPEARSASRGRHTRKAHPPTPMGTVARAHTVLVRVGHAIA